MTDWSAFDDALGRKPPVLWWRDDDAIAGTPALHRLMDLASSVGAPLTLAVIPGNLTDTLAAAIAGRDVTVAVHGWTHTNHAPDSEKKAEFRGHRPAVVMAGELSRGKAILDTAFGPQSLPLFIPPWNRFDPALPLAGCGFTGLSAFGQREVSSENGVIRLDAHIDPIDWRGTRSAVGTQQIVDGITGLLASDAPIGLMTHHLVHDETIWNLTTTIARRLTDGGATWTGACDLMV